MESTDRIPSLLANVHQACYHCFKLPPEVVLQKCAGCRRVSYCGSVCQKANWNKHKKVCKALKAVEETYSRQIVGLMTLPANATGVIEEPVARDASIARVAEITVSSLEKNLGRQIDVPERNLVGWEPRCLACGRSDAVLRMQASLHEPPTIAKILKPCPNCSLSFYCSEGHWDAVKDTHLHQPCATGYNNLSHCDMNKNCLIDTKFAHLVAGAEQGEFKWAPERTKPSWSSLHGLGWGDFKVDIKEAGFPEVMLEQVLRGATNGLSMPMTILWGLENLHEDDAWTRKGTLDIHVLGAASKELELAQIFEEIMHRVPEVKTLKLSFISPELKLITGPNVFTTDMDTCPTCSSKGRKRVQAHHPQTYHDYMNAQGSSYAIPDLAIAFNSGCSQEATESWKTTIDRLVQRSVPTVFTAYNGEEAATEANIIQAAGGKLHPDLGPRGNPWGSALFKTEPNKVDGFYSGNAWLVAGFRGKEE